MSDEQPIEEKSPSAFRVLRQSVVGVAWLAAIVIPVAFFLVFVVGGRDPISLPSDEAVIVSTADRSRNWHPEPPAEHFEHPAAQKLLEIGKSLIAHPDRRDRPARDLNIMAGRPELLDHDQVVFLSVRMAYWRLRNSGDPFASIEVAELLWDAANGLEKRQQTVADAEGPTPRSRPQ